MAELRKRKLQEALHTEPGEAAADDESDASGWIQSPRLSRKFQNLSKTVRSLIIILCVIHVAWILIVTLVNLLVFWVSSQSVPSLLSLLLLLAHVPVPFIAACEGYIGFVMNTPLSAVRALDLLFSISSFELVTALVSVTIRVVLLASGSPFSPHLTNIITDAVSIILALASATLSRVGHQMAGMQTRQPGIITREK